MSNLFIGIDVLSHPRTASETVSSANLGATKRECSEMGVRVVVVFPWIMCISWFQMAERAFRKPARKSCKLTLIASLLEVLLQHL